MPAAARLLAPLLIALAAPSAHGGAKTWHGVRAPAAGPPRSIGGYSAGCVQGAAELPESGPGYRISRPERRRVFGHPRLVAFVRALAKELDARRLGPIWVDDLGQARGGPAPSGHASHQSGLDVDIWFERAPGAEAEPLPLVDLDTDTLTRHFGPRALQLVAEAAKAPEVDRIFLNPVLKRALCEETKGDRGWLRKVRPWFGHHEHFHVRLSCPADSPDCEAQPALPPGDGCEDLQWWLGKAAEAERQKRRGEYQSRVGATPALPKKCRAVLEAPDAVPPR